MKHDKKASFLTELDAVLIDNDVVWKLREPLAYYSKTINQIIIIPAGFQTDFSSVPRIPIIYFFYGNRAHREGVLHDYLYRIDSKPVVTEHIANTIYLEAMKSRSKSWFIRYSIYLGVWIGGFTAYHKRLVNAKLI